MLKQEPVYLHWNTIVRLKGDDDLEKREMGLAYNTIVEEKLAEQAGFKSAREFFTEMLKQAAQAEPDDGLKVRELSRSTLASYGAVAREFDAETFSRFGYSNLYLLQRLRKAAGIDASLPLDEIRVRIRQADGQEIEKPFPECTASDLRAAIRSARPAEPALSAEHEQLLELLNLALDLAVGTELRADVEARVKGGKVLLTVKDVPVELFEDALWSMLDAYSDS